MRITEVRPYEPDPEHLHGAGLDRPASGATSDVYSLDVEGWAVGKSAPVACVEVVHEGRPIVELPLGVTRPEIGSSFTDIAEAERSGFWGSFGGLKLRARFELVLRARLESGQRVPLSALRGEREPLRTGYDPLVQPLMITTHGRSGSTWLVWLLSCHPQVVAFGPFAHDPRVATYWMTVLQELSQPASYLAQLDPPPLATPRWWLGEGAVGRSVRDDAGATRWLGLDAVRSLGAMCQARIDCFYAAQTDVQHDSRRVKYFVEKFSPGLVVTDLLHEIYPRAKEVILVRDFRDMFCSIRAYNARRASKGFGLKQGESDAEYIASTLCRFARSLLQRWRARKGATHLLRYEDLVLEPERAFRELADYLDIDSTPATLKDALERAGSRNVTSHQTAPDPVASIGRWRQDLTPELIELCEEVLGPLLTEFGYAVEPGAELSRAT